MYVCFVDAGENVTDARRALLLLLLLTAALAGAGYAALAGNLRCDDDAAAAGSEAAATDERVAGRPLPTPASGSLSLSPLKFENAARADFC